MGCCFRNKEKQKNSYQKTSSNPQIYLEPQNKTINISVTLINGQKLQYQIPRQTIVAEFKKRIVRKHNKDLIPEQTNLIFNGNTLNSDAKFEEIINSSDMQLLQKKAELWEIEGFQFDRKRVDGVSLQTGTSKMPCRHWFGPQHLKELINYQINILKNNQIECPLLNSQGSACRKIWDLKTCQISIGWTNNQKDVINQQLCLNWQEKYCIKCPRCSHSITRQSIRQKFVQCPSCPSSFKFCVDCKEPWPKLQKICNTPLCYYLRINVVNAPWTRQFMMYKNKQTAENRFRVKVPNVRLCPRPNCNQLIYNIDQCKHTKCICTPVGFSFCFVCLSLAPRQGQEWTCGGAQQYCGFVAPPQIYGDPQSEPSNVINNGRRN